MFAGLVLSRGCRHTLQQITTDDPERPDPSSNPSLSSMFMFRQFLVTGGLGFEVDLCGARWIVSVDQALRQTPAPSSNAGSFVKCRLLRQMPAQGASLGRMRRRFSQELILLGPKRTARRSLEEGAAGCALVRQADARMPGQTKLGSAKRPV